MKFDRMLFDLLRELSVEDRAKFLELWFQLELSRIKGAVRWRDKLHE